MKTNKEKLGVYATNSLERIKAIRMYPSSKPGTLEEIEVLMLQEYSAPLDRKHNLFRSLTVAMNTPVSDLAWHRARMDYQQEQFPLSYVTRQLFIEDKIADNDFGFQFFFNEAHKARHNEYLHLVAQEAGYYYCACTTLSASLVCGLFIPKDAADIEKLVDLFCHFMKTEMQNTAITFMPARALETVIHVLK